HEMYARPSALQRAAETEIRLQIIAAAIKPGVTRMASSRDCTRFMLVRRRFSAPPRRKFDFRFFQRGLKAALEK
ncbi:MAG: hypothetical protein OEU86_07975, partial [Gammaproteobacteria bacterium]|nr:hypothetical protein [Gammaproteobacteria bacterium]